MLVVALFSFTFRSGIEFESKSRAGKKQGVVLWWRGAAASSPGEIYIIMYITIIVLFVCFCLFFCVFFSCFLFVFFSLVFRFISFLLSCQIISAIKVAT
jgi:heme/copper-type cytochrome/quinol oxidase subunit 2